MPDTAAQYFGAMIRDYDSLIERAVPRYHEMLDRLIDYLPEHAESILELGCGTGNLSLRLRQRYPQARLVIVDASPEMIGVTRSRLQTAGAGAVESIEATFETLQVSQEFDIVTSSISLHHVRDKAPVYATILEALRPGGTFRFSDQMRGATEENHAKNWERWLEFCRLPGHCSPEETQSLLDHAEAHDHYTPVREHFRMLEDAGFGSVDCVWRNWIWGIITAERKAESRK